MQLQPKGFKTHKGFSGCGESLPQGQGRAVDMALLGERFHGFIPWASFPTSPEPLGVTFPAHVALSATYILGLKQEAWLS